MRTTTIVVAALCALGPAAARATGVSDDFESYALGAFPSPTWLDAGAFDPLPPVATLPSATVELTTDAFGAPTRALSISDQIALLSGIYQIVPVGRLYSLTADIRVDRFSNGTGGIATDFAPQLTFANAQFNFYITPQAGIYASSLTQRWYVFLIGESGIGANIDLGVPAALGQWYTLSFDLDNLDGSYRARIADTASGSTLVDSSGAFAGWVPGVDGLYDSVAFIEGEGSFDATIPHLAFVDNINVTATPAAGSLAVFGLAPLLLAAARRVRRA
jgi:hypothetical protein